MDKLEKIMWSLKNEGKPNVIGVNYIYFFGIIISCICILINNEIGVVVYALSLIQIGIIISINFLGLQKLKWNGITCSILSIIALLILRLISNFNGAALISFLGQIFILAFCLAIFNCKIDLSTLTKLSKSFLIFFWVIIAVSIYLKIKNEHVDIFQGVFKYLIFTFPFVLMAIKRKLIAVFFLCVFLFILGERTGSVLILLYYFIYLFISWLSKCKALYKCFIITVLVLLLLIPIAIVMLYNSDYATQINNEMIKLSGANFFSGREKIWTIAINAIMEKPFWGYGIRNQIILAHGTTTHNIYLFLILQCGFFGLLLYYCFLYNLWVKFYKYLYIESVKIVASFYVIFLIYGSFELVLFTYAYHTNIIMWLVIGCGIMLTNKLESSNITMRRISK